MRRIQESQLRVIATSDIKIAHRHSHSWMPQASTASSLIALDPAHWSRRHQQTASWVLIEFLHSTRRLH